MSQTFPKITEDKNGRQEIHVTAEQCAVYNDMTHLSTAWHKPTNSDSPVDYTGSVAEDALRTAIGEEAADHFFAQVNGRDFILVPTVDLR